LRRLRTTHPELEAAVDVQIELLALQRRIQGRVTVPAIPGQEAVTERFAQGLPLLRFEHIPLPWTDFRFVLRETAEILGRFDLIEADALKALQALLREGHELEPVVERWFDATQHGEGALAAVLAPGENPPEGGSHDSGSHDSGSHDSRSHDSGSHDSRSHDSGSRDTGSRGGGSREEGARARREVDVAPFEQALTLAIRPFLARCADAILPRVDLTPWDHGYCPLCGSDPELAVITVQGDQWLICGRCTGRWPFRQTTCPFCGNDDKQRLTTFASRDGRYRVAACDACHRYIKAYDERGAARPVLPTVDTIATLPFDAAAMQRGYVG